MKKIVFAIGLAAAASGWASVAGPAYDTLIAHRGESKDAPENTLPAYKMAVDRGFGFECDIYLSSDKRLYTFHDRTLARPGRKIYVEVKGDDPSWVPYIKAVFAKEPKATPDTVLFISFGRNVSYELKRLMPEFKVYWLTGRVPPVAELLAELRALGVDGVDIHFKPEEVTAEYIAAVRGKGFEFHVWTIDDPEKAAEAFRRGAQTVTTNRAKYIHETLQK